MGALSVLNLPYWIFPASTQMTGTEKVIADVKIMTGLYDEHVKTYIAAKIRENLMAEEGYRKTVYLDSVGKPTVGIGHLVTTIDNLSVGDTVTDAQIEEWYNKDTKSAIKTSMEQAITLGRENDTNLLIALVSANYQLGDWSAKLYNTFNHLRKGNWQKAVSNIKQSLWARQTPNRALKFAAAIEQSYKNGVA